ncbi:MAG TPA: hypothetical protein EYN28_06720 [Flavobacteriales bacterium]|jgi:hypothetical protein|nr:hypothetical protein [Flavobacteriales bacterium]HHZ97254.1 hypothetical protein [Flavobacteriales bacterium]HIB76605.1 hypothetical protein [Flavobacteriales bacterium]HIN42040.1 hypothetical protein [Flavobacteriales bacterium]HIO16695.1 hypothetical protein [Flavobacteriales bacterium]
MTRISLLFALGALVLFTGCVEVTFPGPMPMNRRDKTHFPKCWEGDWTFVEQSDDLEEHLTVYSQFITFGDETLVLGNANVLRKFAGYHILSLTNEDSDRWKLILAKRNKDVLSIYQFSAKTDEKVAVWKSILDTDGGSGYEEVSKKSGNEEKVREYKLSPENNAAFRKLIKQGGLTHVGDYVR